MTDDLYRKIQDDISKAFMFGSTHTESAPTSFTAKMLEDAIAKMPPPIDSIKCLYFNKDDWEAIEAWLKDNGVTYWDSYQNMPMPFSGMSVFVKESKGVPQGRMLIQYESGKVGIVDLRKEGKNG